MRMGRFLLGIATMATPAAGCFCFPDPLCARLGHFKGTDGFFVGRVVEIWPTRAEIARQERVRPTQDRRWILERWGAAITPAERQQLQEGRNDEELRWRYRHRQRVRFAVSEVLLGPRVSEVYTQASSCGYRFEKGQTYLVEAAGEAGDYNVHACGATRRLTTAADQARARPALRELRVARTGVAPVKIYGRLAPKDLNEAVQVRLAGPMGDRLELPDADGNFTFDDLDRKDYRVEVADGRGFGSVSVDLKRTGCAEVEAEFEERWKLRILPVGLPLTPPRRPRWVLTEPPASLGGDGGPARGPSKID